MKNSLLVIALLVFTSQLVSQTLFSTSFGNLSLQTYTTSSSSVQYTTAPSTYSLINDGYKNNIGSATNPNKPFNVPALKTQGWAVLYNAIENDTFLVSTSWLDTTAVNVSRWIVTPPVSNIAANSVLTWLAKSPDSNYVETYYVYGTALTGSLNQQSFSVGDQIFSATENATWTRRSVNLSNFAGQTLRFAFRDYSTDKYQLWLDDIEVLTLPNNLDAAVNSIQTQKYVLSGSSQTVSSTISNMSASPINAVTLNYQIGNSTIQTENIAFTNPLGYKQSATANFGLPYIVNTPGNYKLKVWLSGVNFVPDQNHTNDTLVTYITIQNAKARKKVLAEQFINAFDGDCPDAQGIALARQNDSVIFVNIHDLDSLKEINSTGILTAYKKKSATALFDRNYFQTPSGFAVARTYYDSCIAKQLRTVSPASVSIINKTYNATTKQLSFALKADFIGDVKGDLRLNAYLTENNVHGPSTDASLNGYNQLNNFYNVPWSPYYLTGTYYSNSASILSPSQYMHQNTLVFSFDGSFGNAGTIPTTGGTQNQSYQQTFTLTIPTPTNGVNKFNPDNLYIVGFLAEYNSNLANRNVLNAVKEKMTSNAETLGIKELDNQTHLSVYPNPSNGNLYLYSNTAINNYEIKVLDLTGRCLLLENLNQAGNQTSLDLSRLNNGIYFLQISCENGSIVEKIVIQKN